MALLSTGTDKLTISGDENVIAEGLSIDSNSRNESIQSTATMAVRFPSDDLLQRHAIDAYPFTMGLDLAETKDQN